MSTTLVQYIGEPFHVQRGKTTVILGTLEYLLHRNVPVLLVVDSEEMAHHMRRKTPVRVLTHLAYMSGAGHPARAIGLDIRHEKLIQRLDPDPLVEPTTIVDFALQRLATFVGPTQLLIARNP